MLETVDLTKKLKKATYKQAMRDINPQLYALQKAAWDADIPTVIIFEGWDASGKVTTIQKLTAPLDPRGFKVYATYQSRLYEAEHPWMWRFWLKIPARGQWAIFHQSWYGRVLAERVEKRTPEQEWRRAYRDIVDFERMLTDDGYLLLKFFLHISKQEQKQRFTKLSQDPLTAWHITHEDWGQNGKYAQYVQAIEEMFVRTEAEWAPWTIIEATDRRHTRVKVFTTIIEALTQRLAAIDALPPDWHIPANLLNPFPGIHPNTGTAQPESSAPPSAPVPDGKPV